MKRAAIYGRVSTGKQVAGELSIPDQLRQCEAYAEARGFEVVERFVDAGVSARTDKRPEFQRMIKVACAPHGPINVILVHSQSRFARNTRDLLVYQAQLETNGVRLVSITQDLGEGETADVLRTMVGALDEYQSKETAKHVSRSMIENARQGFWNGSQPPLGYRTYAAETRGARIKKKIEVEPHEAEIVRLIFRLYVQGDGASGPLGVKQVAARINADGYRQRDGRPFRIQYIDKILRNTAYAGEHYFNRQNSRTRAVRPRSEWVPFPIPRIVDDAIFYAAQDKLDRQHPLKTPPRLVRSEVLLTSVACCGQCGAPLRKRTGKGGRYHYYSCSKRSDAGETACAGLSIPMRVLDDAVIEVLEEKVLAPKRLDRLTRALVARASEREEALGARRHDLDGERGKAKRQLAELYRLVGSGELEMDATLSAHVKGLQQRVDAITRQIAHIDHQRSVPIDALSDADIEAFGRAVSGTLRNPDNRAFARAYVQGLVSEVTVSDDEIKVTGPKAALMHQTALFAAKGELVPTFASNWRTRQS